MSKKGVKYYKISEGKIDLIEDALKCIKEGLYEDQKDLFFDISAILKILSDVKKSGKIKMV